MDRSLIIECQNFFIFSPDICIITNRKITREFKIERKILRKKINFPQI